jgi:hypothetical protein
MAGTVLPRGMRIGIIAASSRSPSAAPIAANASAAGRLSVP